MTFDANADVAVDLTREALRRGRSWRDRARGGSMRPLIPAGSELEAVPCDPLTLHVGDVVLVALPGPGGRHPARLVAHRLLVPPDATGRPARTKGDRSPRPDPPVPAGGVLGLVAAATLPDGRRRELRSPAWRAIGLLVALASPWLGLAETVYRSVLRGR